MDISLDQINHLKEGVLFLLWRVHGSLIEDVDGVFDGDETTMKLIVILAQIWFDRQIWDDVVDQILNHFLRSFRSGRGEIEWQCLRLL